MIGVASFHGGPSGVLGVHLVFFVLSFEVGNGGGRVAGVAFPFCSLFCQCVCPLVSLNIDVTGNPVNVGLDSSGG